MKRIYIILIISILIVILGITIYILNENNKNEEKILAVNFNTSELVKSIIENEYISKDMNINSMQNITELEINSIYNIDNNLLNQFSGLIPMINLSADEILIVEVKNINDIEEIKIKFKEKSEHIAKKFENYLQKEYLLASNPLIYSKGKYVIFAISDNNNEIKSIFENEFK